MFPSAVILPKGLSFEDSSKMKALALFIICLQIIIVAWHMQVVHVSCYSDEILRYQYYQKIKFQGQIKDA